MMAPFATAPVGLLGVTTAIAAVTGNAAKFLGVLANDMRQAGNVRDTVDRLNNARVEADKKLVENGYLVQERAPHDKRSTRVKLSEKGLRLCEQIDALYQRNVDTLQQNGTLSQETLQETNQTLSNLEQFWSDYINSTYRM